MVAPDDRTAPAEFPANRFVVLGASNVIRGISTVIETARRMADSPIDVLVAAGHGRSYGGNSCVLGRGLPGIISCGIWDALSERPPAATSALVTDVGNDILYGAHVPQIVAWVESCLDRLAPMSGRIVVTELPLESIARLDRVRYLAMRTILFPQSRVALPEAVARAEALNESLKQLAGRCGARLVKPRVEWFGFDPIHIRRRHGPAAWREMLAPLCKGELPAAARRSFGRWLYLRTRRAHRWSLFGLPLRCPQPSGELRAGVVVSLY